MLSHRLFKLNEYKLYLFKHHYIYFYFSYELDLNLIFKSFNDWNKYKTQQTLKNYTNILASFATKLLTRLRWEFNFYVENIIKN